MPRAVHAMEHVVPMVPWAGTAHWPTLRVSDISAVQTKSSFLKSSRIQLLIHKISEHNSSQLGY